MVLPKQLEPQTLIFLPQRNHALIEQNFRDKGEPVQRVLGH
jgi:hypothetical protein